MRLAVTWHPRAQPLRPCGALGLGTARAALIARLLRLDDEHLARLTGVAGREVVAVLGEEEHLPWVDQIRYVGTDPSAPALLLPTTHAPSVQQPLLQRAILGRCPEGAAPVALPGGAHALLAVPLGGARPLLRSRLAELA
ncbi:MAG: hypothetical protein KTR31_23570 [Myxococcales bacterium]|nr:hypothetical protein [Myxococcales bacterium]